MNNLLQYKNFYLVGIKGVAMTSLTQCLIDAGKNVRGSDVKENFVTKKHLDRLKIKIDIDFESDIPANVDCVVYTAAHQGKYNSQVIRAQKKGLATYSHAEALAILVNQKKGIAVCGVGGKSTVSAMITWILTKTKKDISFSVGVGDIINLNKTGQWTKNSDFFIAEADEYVTDPLAVQHGEEITPRFSYLKPYITVCNSLKYDHPDVYRDYQHTKEVFAEFFGQIKDNGFLIFNSDNYDLAQIARQKNNTHLISFGTSDNATFQLIDHLSIEGKNSGTFLYKAEGREIPHILTLKVPGKFNIMNGLAAIAACYAAGIDVKKSVKALSDFASTLRRFEFVGEKSGIKYYDDYAHHPSEVKAAIKALNEWCPNNRKIIAFQSHTFSRTQQLFNDFVDAFADCQEVVMIDIFPSAREKFDPTVSSDLLCKKIREKYPQIKAENLKTHQAMAEYLQKKLKKGDVCITLGAGDINKVHQLIK